MPTLPAPLIVRRAHAEEAGALAALLGRAYPTETWDAAGTARELFGDETVKATLVVAAAGRLIATASLQVHPEAPACGWLRWVATEQDRRREGLARALVIGVLAIAERAGCREARLRTTTDRLAAIALYSQLGFEPLVRSEPEREAWERVLIFAHQQGGTMSAPSVVATEPGTNEVVVRRFFELMDAHRFDELESVFAPDLRFQLGSATMTREGLISFIRGFYDAFPDWRHHVEDLFSSGTRVVARAADHGTHRGDFQGIPATGRTITLGQIAIYEIADGRIVEAWEQADVAGLMAQLTAS
jgi:steroid delta-isomerase-like uncharacterized protein